MPQADQVIRAFFESWKRNDPDEVAGFFTEEASYTDGPRGTHHGREAIRGLVATVRARFPTGFDVTVSTLVSDRRTVMVERTDRFEVGGRTFEMAVAGAFEVNEHGLIKRWRDYFDLQQIQAEIAASLKGPDKSA